MIAVFQSTTNGVDLYHFSSPRLGGSNNMYVLEPDSPVAGMPHRFVYLLPVIAGADDDVFGSAMDTALGLNLHNLFNATLIEARLDTEPWYGNHTSDQEIQQESFHRSDLVSWARQHLEHEETDEHWLVGFSKSGYGAISLIMRNPTTFDRAAAWDAPVDLENTDLYDMLDIFGTEDNYQDNYRLTQDFVDAHAEPFTSRKRLWLSGDVATYDAVDTGYHTQVATLAGRFRSAGVQYMYFSGLETTHAWDAAGDWLQRAFAGLQRCYETERDVLNETFTVSATTNISDLDTDAGWAYGDGEGAGVGSGSIMYVDADLDRLTMNNQTGALFVAFMAGVTVPTVSQEIVGVFNMLDGNGAGAGDWTMLMPTVRGSGAAGDDYYTTIFNYGGAIDLYRCVDGALTQVAVNYAPVVTQGTHVIKLRATGTNPVRIDMWVDYGDAVTYNDSNAARLQSGVPGVMGFVATTSTARPFADDLAVRNPDDLDSWTIADEEEDSDVADQINMDDRQEWQVDDTKTLGDYTLVKYANGRVMAYLTATEAAVRLDVALSTAFDELA